MKTHPILDFISLTKPRIVVMSVVMAVGGYCLAQRVFDLSVFIILCAGTALSVGAANTLNMVFERQVDQRMQRTRRRPLPDGRLSPSSAFIFGVCLGISALYILITEVNLLTAALAGFAMVVYVCVYTPLKLHTPTALLIGAIPGAIPPLMGWTAATAAIETPGLILFGILLLWQIPHFIAISLYRKVDYAAAGIRTHANVHGDNHAKVQACTYATALIPISLLLVGMGVASWVYGVCALIAGLVYMAISFQGFLPTGETTALWSRKLFWVSLIYLPVISVALILDVVLL